jgi:hypothetical protein
LSKLQISRGDRGSVQGWNFVVLECRILLRLRADELTGFV